MQTLVSLSLVSGLGMCCAMLLVEFVARVLEGGVS